MRTIEEAKGMLVPAAQYLRASSEHQQFSTANQSQAIAIYAASNGLHVAQTYVDEAKSGLVLKHRPGLQQLLRDVVSGSAPYKAILVYDVSRWGRFLDSDESAHYEFLCKSAGVPVHYCAEIFGNDSSLPNLLMKAIKRSMAGEYSRELSIKVHRGVEGIVRRGFRSGGLPGYGLRRVLVGHDGCTKHPLKRHERKSISSDRVVFALGPSNEVQCVREIYQMYIEKRMSHSAIARVLNDSCIPGPEPRHKAGQSVLHEKRKWTADLVRGILTRAKYKGSIVYNKTTQYLQSQRKHCPECDWVIVPDAFEAIVNAETFQKALDVRNSKTWHQSDAQLLERLRTILNEEGKLSIRILSERLGSPTASACRRRFGSMANAYKLLDYTPRKLHGMDFRGKLYSMRKALMENLVSIFPTELKVTAPGLRWRTILRHKTGLKISVRVCRHRWPPAKGQRWVIEYHGNENSSVTLLALLNSSNTALERFLLLPRLPVDRKVTVGLKDPSLHAAVLITDLTQFIATLDGIRIRRRAEAA